MMNEMTSKEAIKILKGAIKKPNTKDGYLGQAVEKAIKALESQRWIPVSERLPASDEDLLVTNGRGMYIGWIDLLDKMWRVDSDSEYFMYDIVAWMPLPTSYVPDINVGNISNRTPQIAIFDFKAFLNIAMLNKRTIFKTL